MRKRIFGFEATLYVLESTYFHGETGRLDPSRFCHSAQIAT